MVDGQLTSTVDIIFMSIQYVSLHWDVAQCTYFTMTGLSNLDGTEMYMSYSYTLWILMYVLNMANDSSTQSMYHHFHIQYCATTYIQRVTITTTKSSTSRNVVPLQHYLLP